MSPSSKGVVGKSVQKLSSSTVNRAKSQACPTYRACEGERFIEKRLWVRFWRGFLFEMALQDPSLWIYSISGDLTKGIFQNRRYHQKEWGQAEKSEERTSAWYLAGNPWRRTSMNVASRVTCALGPRYLPLPTKRAPKLQTLGSGSPFNTGIAG